MIDSTTEVMNKLRPLIKRASRLEVDKCINCPFSDLTQLTCKHEDAPRDEADLFLTSDTDDPPPEWCPMRGQLLLLCGPKVDTEGCEG